MNLTGNVDPNLILTHFLVSQLPAPQPLLLQTNDPPVEIPQSQATQVTKELERAQRPLKSDNSLSCYWLRESKSNLPDHLVTFEQSIKQSI